LLKFSLIKAEKYIRIRPSIAKVSVFDVFDKNLLWDGANIGRGRWCVKVNVNVSVSAAKTSPPARS
jgi:hypothetical protein